MEIQFDMQGFAKQLQSCICSAQPFLRICCCDSVAPGGCAVVIQGAFGTDPSPDVTGEYWQDGDLNGEPRYTNGTYYIIYNNSSYVITDSATETSSPLFFSFSGTADPFVEYGPDQGSNFCEGVACP